MMPGASLNGWLGANPSERAARIQDGTLRMTIVFGTERAMDAWRHAWDAALTATGAAYRAADHSYTWPNGSRISLVVAQKDDTRPIRGQVLTDYEIDTGVGWRYSGQWRHMLELMKRR